jgi:hypothetical protein
MATVTMATVPDESTDLKLSLALEVLGSMGEARLAVGGASMLPSIWPGDILEIHRAAAADLSLGDIVVFARDNRLIVHRVLRVNRELDELVLITRGDRSPRADAAVPFSELLGKVKAIQRGRRNIGPRLTWWRQIASWILLRSELCTRVLLHFAAIRRNSLTPEPL